MHTREGREIKVLMKLQQGATRPRAPCAQTLTFSSTSDASDAVELTDVYPDSDGSSSVASAGGDVTKLTRVVFRLRGSFRAESVSAEGAEPVSDPWPEPEPKRPARGMLFRGSAHDWRSKGRSNRRAERWDNLSNFEVADAIDGAETSGRAPFIGLSNFGRSMCDSSKAGGGMKGGLIGAMMSAGSLFMGARPMPPCRTAQHAQKDARVLERRWMKRTRR